MTSPKLHICSASRSKTAVITISIIVIVAALFWLFLCLSDEKHSGIVQGNFDKRPENNPYTFINPLLDSAHQIDDEQSIFEVELKDSLTTLIQNSSEITASVYFSELTKQNEIYIDSGEKYNLASLIKVPLMMGYYKQEENEPGLLATQLAYNGEDQNLIELIKGDAALKPDTSYPVEEIIDSMIINSDNNAATVLHQFKNQIIRTTFTDLNVDLPKEDIDISKSDYITAEQYSMFFKVLYNSSYLNRTNSERALGLLARTTYKDGIVAGVSSDTKVAHKFGERGIKTNNVMVFQQFHDCGIVYKTDNPYLLCVMTRGKDLDRQQTLVQNISRTVFEMVSK